MDDGTPLYCADPSTTIASECGCESCRAVHQIAVAVETTSRTTASTTAPTTRPTRLPARTPTRHGYHARLSRSEEHTSELQSRQYIVCRLLLEKQLNSEYPTIRNLYVVP